MTLLLRILLMLPALLAGPALAQGDAATEAAAPAPVADQLGRETPRMAVAGLIRALADQDYARAGRYFELSSRRGETAEDEGANYARRLQVVLDRSGTLEPFSLLSRDPSGNIDDGYAPDIEEVGHFAADGEQVPITLKRSEGDGGGQIWLVSRETISTVRAETRGIDPEARSESDELSVGGAPLKDWLLLLGSAAASFVGFRLIGAGVVAFARIWVRDRETNSAYRFLQAAMPPLSLYLAVVAFYIWAEDLQVAIVARQLLLRYASIVAWLAGAWFALRLIDASARVAAARMQQADRRQAVSVITLLRRSAKIILLVVTVVAVLDTIGFDVTTGIAALGIGGIALALGAQKTIENLVGSVTVIADRPVQIGDFCRVGDVVGTVEDIGMRSTRIRTNERTVVTIPNGAFASLQIENFSRRDRFLFNPTISVEYGAEAAALRRGVEAVEKLLKEHPNIDGAGARARLATLAASSIDIEVFSYITVSDFTESLGIRQELLLSILDCLERQGLALAFPSRTVILRDETGQRRERAEYVEDEARENEARDREAAKS